MKLLIIGSGRMGQRHLQGAINVPIISKITICDVDETALSRTTEKFITHESFHKIEFKLLSKINFSSVNYDYVIITNTANHRIDLIKSVVKCNPSNILIEKPLGQSMEEVKKMILHCLLYSKIRFDVNLNMRLYDGFVQLKHDLNTFKQFQGVATVTLNTGTIGIGANGIHYLDLMFFLFDADSYNLDFAEIEEKTIPSGRGEKFLDFGGVAYIKFFSCSKMVAKVFFSLSNISTAFGSWEILGPNGKISIDEIKQLRIDCLRKEDSEMPVNRYAADYLQPKLVDFKSPSLSDLTEKWINGIIDGNFVLPCVQEALLSHSLMFEWLNFSKTHNNHFPIT